MDEAQATPVELHALLATDALDVRDREWERFVSLYSRLLFHAARSLGGDRDATMDGYAAILEALHADDCRRLRAYVADGRTRFSTWLLIVARRIAVDHHRTRYGRGPPAGGTGPPTEAVTARRRLADLLTEKLSEDQAPTAAESAPDQPLRRHELHRALETALGALGPPDRLLLSLRFIHDVPVRDIARQLRFPTVFHAYRRIAALRAELRRRLATLGVEDPEP